MVLGMVGFSVGFSFATSLISLARDQMMRLASPSRRAMLLYSLASFWMSVDLGEAQYYEALLFRYISPVGALTPPCGSRVTAKIEA